MKFIILKKTKKRLFEEYVNKFLKINQECSGYPKELVSRSEQEHVPTGLHCHREINRDEYINNYLNKEGIKLDKDKIKENIGLRTVAKIMLNSMWG